MTSEDLRTALLNRDFERAQRLIRQWGEEAAQRIAECRSPEERRRIFDDARAFGEQNLYLAQVVRAHISAELHANSASFLYAGSNPEQSRWNVRG